MTITINVPRETESQLQAEADRAGLPVEKLVERVIAERFDLPALAVKESAQEFFDRIAKPGPIIDASRENIYADL
jgi:hypothetical protein